MFLDYATELDCWRYITRSKVSDLEAAFLVCSYLPISNFSISNSSSKIEREIYEVYLYLKDGATQACHPKIIKEGDHYYAKLELWTGFLFSMDHPVSEALFQTFQLHEQIELSKASKVDKTTTSEHPVNSEQ